MISLPRRTVYIFSMVPRLCEVSKRMMPEIDFKTVVIKEDISKKYEKIVSDEELLQLIDAKVLLVDGNLLSQIYEKLPNVEWAQCTWAGVEQMARKIKGETKPTFPLARMSTPSFCQLMSEYTVGWIINYERGWLLAREYQKESTWAHKDRIATYRSLKDITVGILGVGLIGSAVIRALKFFECRVMALGRREIKPTTLQVDKYYSTKDLPLLLKESDYVVNVLPSTDETVDLLGKKVLQHAKKCPVLINIGRGDIIKEEDIITALDKNWISAAILDVFLTEPLPKSSPLWHHPKIYITPHAAGVSRPEDVVEAFADNFNRYLKNEPLINVIDWDKGY